MTKQDFDILDGIFENVNEWLKFAETKNAVLLVFISAVAVALLKDGAVITYIRGNEWGQYYFYNFVLFWSLGLSIVLMSFLPQTKLTWLWKEKERKNPNLFFYTHLAAMQPDALVKVIYPDAENDVSLNQFRTCLANQIVTNSQITVKKFNYFRVGLWFVLSAVFTPVISALLYCLLDPHCTKIVED